VAQATEQAAKSKTTESFSILGIGLEERRLRLELVQGGATHTIKRNCEIKQDLVLHKKWFLQLFDSSLRISVISALSTFYDLQLTRSPQRYAEIAEKTSKLERDCQGSSFYRRS